MEAINFPNVVRTRNVIGQKSSINEHRRLGLRKLDNLPLPPQRTGETGVLWETRRGRSAGYTRTASHHQFEAENHNS